MDRKTLDRLDFVEQVVGLVAMSLLTLMLLLGTGAFVYSLIARC